MGKSRWILCRISFTLILNASSPSSITTPCKETFTVQFVGHSRTGGPHCRVRTEQIERGDGVIIIRYRPIVTCWDVQLVVKWRDEHVGESPYTFSENLYPEKCHCPQKLSEFVEAANCPMFEDQIKKDLTAFRSLNYTKMRKSLLDEFQASHASSLAVCQYLVKENRVYRQCFGEHVGFKMFVDSLLLSLVRKVKLPDFEIFVNLGDWPVMKKGGKSRTAGPKPIFSWCGSDDSFDIVMPTYDLTESTIDNMDRVTLDIISVQKGRVPWEEKQNKAFWRGRDARKERLQLVDLARRQPDLINASLTNFFFFRDQEAKYGKEKHISFFKFFDYRYSINIDGTVAAYRLPYLLAGDSLLMKQESTFYEHFYKKLKPYEHYLPFKRDLSNLIEQIKWAQENEDLVLKMIQNANEFVNQNLMPRNIYCYHVLLFWVSTRRSLQEVLC